MGAKVSMSIRQGKKDKLYLNYNINLDAHFITHTYEMMVILRKVEHHNCIMFSKTTC